MSVLNNILILGTTDLSSVTTAVDKEISMRFPHHPATWQIIFLLRKSNWETLSQQQTLLTEGEAWSCLLAELARR